jgi:Putative Ig domain
VGSVPRQLKTLALSGALILGCVALGATSAASAESPPPEILKTYSGKTIYPCSNGTCTIGPGDTGMPFAAALIGIGGPPQTLESNSYKMSVVSGSLPPGLRLALPDAEWMILGTPTKAGTYTFTIQIAALAGGPDSREEFSITIGTGSADNLVVGGASYLEKFGRLQVAAFDVNVGASYTFSNTATGKKLGTLAEVNSGDGEPSDGDGRLVGNVRISSLTGPVPEKVTVTDSLGSVVTVPVVRVAPYR